jgi:hypothetical protein
MVGFGSDVATWAVEPSLRWTFKQSPRLTLGWGLEGSLHDFTQGTPTGAQPDQFTLAQVTKDLKRLTVGSAFVEALWRPTPRWLVRPGVRGDLYYDNTASRNAVDPRLTVRYRLLTRDLPDVSPTSDDSAVFLKAAVGLYHQPPRFVLPLPGLDTMPLKYGLLRALQTSLGAEVPLGARFSFGLEGYFSYLDPTIFDFAFNQQDLNTLANGTLLPTTTVPPASRAQEVIDRLLQKNTGRAYGLEVLLRRQARTGPYGWVSYTLSHAERLHDGVWAPYDFDRMHLVNLVAGLPLPRNWDVGARLQYQSGKPATTTYGYNTARTDGYLRIDVRIDKRAAYKGWLLDFYVDLLNAALLPEEVFPGQTIRYVLPSAGVRGRF